MANNLNPEWIENELLRVPDVKKRSTHRDSQKPRHAVAARYERSKGRVVIELDNGTEFSFPPKLAGGLGEATPKELSVIEISPLGTGLHWPQLDVDLTVDGLISGVFGSRAWMRGHAARAGSVSSPAKALAARENGAKGGRPQKTKASA